MLGVLFSVFLWRCCCIWSFFPLASTSRLSLSAVLWGCRCRVSPCDVCSPLQGSGAVRFVSPAEALARTTRQSSLASEFIVGEETTPPLLYGLTLGPLTDRQRTAPLSALLCMQCRDPTTEGGANGSTAAVASTERQLTATRKCLAALGGSAPSLVTRAHGRDCSEHKGSGGGGGTGGGISKDTDRGQVAFSPKSTLQQPQPFTRRNSRSIASSHDATKPCIPVNWRAKVCSETEVRRICFFAAQQWRVRDDRAFLLLSIDPSHGQGSTVPQRLRPRSRELVDAGTVGPPRRLYTSRTFGFWSADCSSPSVLLHSTAVPLAREEVAATRALQAALTIATRGRSDTTSRKYSAAVPRACSSTRTARQAGQEIYPSGCRLSRFCWLGLCMRAPAPWPANRILFSEEGRGAADDLSAKPPLCLRTQNVSAAQASGLPQTPPVSLPLHATMSMIEMVYQSAGALRFQPGFGAARIVPAAASNNVDVCPAVAGWLFSPTSASAGAAGRGAHAAAATEAVTIAPASNGAPKAYIDGRRKGAKATQRCHETRIAVNGTAARVTWLFRGSSSLFRCCGVLPSGIREATAEVTCVSDHMRTNLLSSTYFTRQSAKRCRFNTACAGIELSSFYSSIWPSLTRASGSGRLMYPPPCTSSHRVPSNNGRMCRPANTSVAAGACEHKLVSLVGSRKEKSDTTVDCIRYFDRLPRHLRGVSTPSVLLYRQSVWRNSTQSWVATLSGPLQRNRSRKRSDLEGLKRVVVVSSLIGSRAGRDTGKHVRKEGIKESSMTDTDARPRYSNCCDSGDDIEDIAFERAGLFRKTASRIQSAAQLTRRPLVRTTGAAVNYSGKALQTESVAPAVTEERVAQDGIISDTRRRANTIKARKNISDTTGVETSTRLPVVAEATGTDVNTRKVRAGYLVLKASKRSCVSFSSDPSASEEHNKSPHEAARGATARRAAIEGGHEALPRDAMVATSETAPVSKSSDVSAVGNDSAPLLPTEIAPVGNISLTAKATHMAEKSSFIVGPPAGTHRSTRLSAAWGVAVGTGWSGETRGSTTRRLRLTTAGGKGSRALRESGVSTTSVLDPNLGCGGDISLQEESTVSKRNRRCRALIAPSRASESLKITDESCGEATDASVAQISATDPHKSILATPAAARAASDPVLKIGNVTAKDGSKWRKVSLHAHAESNVSLKLTRQGNGATAATASLNEERDAAKDARWQKGDAVTVATSFMGESDAAHGVGRQAGTAALAASEALPYLFDKSFSSCVTTTAAAAAYDVSTGINFSNAVASGGARSRSDSSTAGKAERKTPTDAATAVSANGASVTSARKRCKRVAGQQLDTTLLPNSRTSAAPTKKRAVAQGTHECWEHVTVALHEGESGAAATAAAAAAQRDKNKNNSRTSRTVLHETEPRHNTSKKTVKRRTRKRAKTSECGECAKDGRRRLLAIIDGSCLAFRSHYGMPEVLDGRGIPVQAILGFFRSLSGIKRALLQPSHLVVVFDSSSSRSSRLAIYDGYKGNRNETPPTLQQQFLVITRLCHALGVCTISEDGVEADDVIASLVNRACISTRQAAANEGAPPAFTLANPQAGNEDASSTCLPESTWPPSDFAPYFGHASSSARAVRKRPACADKDLRSSASFSEERRACQAGGSLFSSSRATTAPPPKGQGSDANREETRCSVENDAAHAEDGVFDEIVVVTTDKDLLQVLQHNYMEYDSRGGGADPRPEAYEWDAHPLEKSRALFAWNDSSRCFAVPTAPDTEVENGLQSSALGRSLKLAVPWQKVKAPSVGSASAISAKFFSNTSALDDEIIFEQTDTDEKSAVFEASREVSGEGCKLREEPPFPSLASREIYFSSGKEAAENTPVELQGGYKQPANDKLHGYSREEGGKGVTFGSPPIVTQAQKSSRGTQPHLQRRKSKDSAQSMTEEHAVGRAPKKQGINSHAATVASPPVISIPRVRGPYVRIMQLHRKLRMVDENWVLLHYGVLPHQLCDYLALVGDAVDGIRGCDGIGAVTARKLIAHANGRLNDLLGDEQRLSRLVKRNQLRNLLKFAPLLERNRQLISLDSNIESVRAFPFSQSVVRSIRATPILRRAKAVAGNRRVTKAESSKCAQSKLSTFKHPNAINAPRTLGCRAETRLFFRSNSRQVSYPHTPYMRVLPGVWPSSILSKRPLLITVVESGKVKCLGGI